MVAPRLPGAVEHLRIVVLRSITLHERLPDCWPAAGKRSILTSMIRLPTRSIAVASAFLATGLAAASLRGQDTSLRAERTVPFTTGKAISLNAKVGPVGVQSVEFSDRGRATSGLPGRRTTPPETSTILRGRFMVENPSSDEWEVTFTVEFRDKDGKGIDRAVKKAKWEGQAKPLDFDHTLLAYVVPLIADVRVTLEARLD